VGWLQHMPEERTPGPPRRGAARWSPRGRAVRLALAAVGLLALVAVGSLRQPPGATSGSPRFPSALVETLALLAFLGVLAGAGLAAWTLLPGRGLVVPRRRRHGSFYWPLILLLSVLVLAWLRKAGWLDGLLRLVDRGQQSTPVTAPALSTVPPQPLPRGGPRWLPFVLVGTLLLGLAVAVLIRSELARRRRAALARPGELAELFDHALDDLEHETDPRRAVIAAWIRMERGLAAAGLPRHAAEAPFEYAARVLERASVQPASVSRLADLFEQAKFSQHTIDERMRQAAVEAVTAIREELAAQQELLDAATGSPEVVR
jgi:hypothetical protein